MIELSETSNHLGDRRLGEVTGRFIDRTFPRQMFPRRVASQTGRFPDKIFSLHEQTS